jgi:hypothetical protein
MQIHWYKHRHKVVLGSQELDIIELLNALD